MNLFELETPCLIIDKSKVQKNINNLCNRLNNLGIKLRSHGKTAKNIDIFKMFPAMNAESITVSTLKEAEYYFNNGIKDIIYAVGIAPVKLKRIADLIKQGADIKITLDSIEQTEIVIDKAKEFNVIYPVLIELDCDGHRSGIQTNDPLLVELGKLLHIDEGTILQGILTHAGKSYQSNTIDEIKRIAKAERECAVKCAVILRKNNLPCPIVSIGSTPTANFIDDVTGITEIRAGVFIFQDLVMAGLGVCDIDDIAISVLTSVIGFQKPKGWVITDAGWMALSRDIGTSAQKIDQGYGVVCDISGNPLDNLIVNSTNQEHGIVADRAGNKTITEKFLIGDMVRILPNHACATGAMHDKYYVVDSDSEIINVWDRISGW
jgi:D-serine deaminase-like pyridoxal phosphate-dependent protein